MFGAGFKAVLKAVFDDIFAVPRPPQPPHIPSEATATAPVRTEPKAKDEPAQGKSNEKSGRTVSKVIAKPVVPQPKVWASPAVSASKPNAVPVDTEAKVQAEIAALRRMAPLRPRQSVRYDAYIERFDEDDEDDGLGMVSLAETEHVIFSYRDAGGNETDRHVMVERAGEDHFQGFCMMRMDTRTFLYSRIIGKVTRLDTGEILTKAKWRRGLVDID
ncbi:hypothetical protein SAMN04488595_103168 [Ralstonia sp. 25mfcol4.1]|uniref:hypothetical protein n=1 Tax=Burkholderiaceae TaxID=119060 RepID=UPI00048B05B4|nr:hypothetical protein [Ralstonia sp. 25mfcol4.1]SDO94521.1 hypothetical protein SAMN04488595_103168 [Ralstonia sp. 25mfcol4.1]